MHSIPPFVANSPDNVHCVNAVFRMLLQHFLSEDMSWEEIDRATFASADNGTWTVGGDMLLAKKGVHVTNIEPVDYIALQKEGVAYLYRTFGPEVAKYYEERSNILDILEHIDEFLTLVSHKTARVQPRDIIQELQKDRLVGATVNTSIFNNTKGFSLHYILIYAYRDELFHVHDPGLPPHPSRTISEPQFESCFDFPGANGGIDIFYA